MGKTTKTLLIIVCILVVLCICGCVMGVVLMGAGGGAFMKYAVVDDPVEAQAVSQSMIDYQLPAGYQESMVMNMVIFKAAIALNVSDTISSPMIMIAEMPSLAAMDADTFRTQLQSGMNSAQGGENYSLTLVDQYSTMINGEEVPIFIYEGVSNEGLAIRQLISGMFPGKEGQIMIMVMGASAGWNQSEIDAFIESIHS